MQRRFDKHTPVPRDLEAHDEPVALTFDGTFFGRGYGLMIYRAHRKNIHWQEMESETLAVIEQGLLHLTMQGWRFSSVTIDGRKGTISLIERLFPSVPVQFCVFHQKAIIRRYLTTKPKTLCGQELRVLVSFLTDIAEPLFLDCLADIKDRYSDFLKERNEQGQFKHRKIRSALRSLTTNAEYVYAWDRHPELDIPRTTNSCDGSFAHWKNKVKIHRGLSAARRTKMIKSLLAHS